MKYQDTAGGDGRLHVFKEGAGEVLRSIAELAAAACAADGALLTLAGGGDAWIAARYGMEGLDKPPHELAMCSLTSGDDGVFEACEATAEILSELDPDTPRLPPIGFYAAAPIVSAPGLRVGVLSVFGPRARRLEAVEKSQLSRLAKLAGQALGALAHSAERDRAPLERSARLHLGLVESRSELSCLFEPGGSIVYASPSYGDAIDFDATSLAGASFFEMLDPADRGDAARWVEQVFATGNPQPTEWRIVSRRDGSQRWISWRLGVQEDGSGGRLLRAVGRDVTERRLKESRERDSFAMLARAAQLAEVGGWSFDLRSGEMLWSDQMRRIHEVELDFVPTLDAAMAFLAPASRSAVRKAESAAMAWRRPWELEFAITTARGRAVWIRAVGEAEFEGDSPIRLHGAYTDVTRRRLVEERLDESERFARLATDNVPTRIGYLDASLRFRFANAAYCERFGRERSEVLGKTREELTGRPYEDRTAAVIAEVLRGERSSFETWETVGDDARLIEFQLVPDFGPDGEVRGFFSAGADITGRAATERELRARTRSLRAVVEAIPAMIAVVGLDSRVRFVNSAYERWTGLDRSQAVGSRLDASLAALTSDHGRDWTELAMAGATGLFGGVAKSAGVEFHLTGIHSPLLDGEGRVDGFICVAQDITERKLAEVGLLRLSRLDPLTGLLNRAGFEAEAERLIAEGGAGALALLCVDLDRFKPVNDLHGHLRGDEVLRMFAERMRRLVRPTDPVARLGGDEFAVLLPGIAAPFGAELVAGKIVAAAAEAFECGGLVLSVGASVGVAFKADKEGGWKALFERADAMLYEAKNAGRGRHASQPWT